MKFHIRSLVVRFEISESKSKKKFHRSITRKQINNGSRNWFYKQTRHFTNTYIIHIYPFAIPLTAVKSLLPIVRFIRNFYFERTTNNARERTVSANALRHITIWMRVTELDFITIGAKIKILHTKHWYCDVSGLNGWLNAVTHRTLFFFTSRNLQWIHSEFKLHYTLTWKFCDTFNNSAIRASRIAIAHQTDLTCLYSEENEIHISIA